MWKEPAPLEVFETQMEPLAETSSYDFQYSHDLFFIGPFYHLAFQNLDNLIATDLDMEFRWL